MLKYIVLISLILPASAHAHDWNNDYWLERILRNHDKIGKCYKYLIDDERETFTKNCSVHAMGYTENTVFKEFYQEWEDHHPDIDDIKFIYSHFPQLNAADNTEVYENIAIRGIANSLIMQMYIADAIIRTDRQLDNK